MPALKILSRIGSLRQSCNLRSYLIIILVIIVIIINLLLSLLFNWLTFPHVLLTVPCSFQSIPTLFPSSLCTRCAHAGPCRKTKKAQGLLVIQSWSLQGFQILLLCPPYNFILITLITSHFISLTFLFYLYKRNYVCYKCVSVP